MESDASEGAVRAVSRGTESNPCERTLSDVSQQEGSEFTTWGEGGPGVCEEVRVALLVRSFEAK